MEAVTVLEGGAHPCYELIADMLKACQLEEYIQVFIDNSVDDEVLKILDDEGLKDLVPLVGHRMKIKSYLKNWKSKNDSILGNLSLIDLDVYNIPVEIADSKCGEKEYDGSSEYGLNSGNTIRSRPDPPEVASEADKTSVSLFNSPYELNSSSSDGRAILAEGKRTDGLLKQSDRRRLSQIIILHLLENNSARVISAVEFSKLATDIQQLFPKENSLVYFSPYESGKNGRKKNSSGKLYEAYISRRRKLRARGELPGTSRSSTSSSASTATASTSAAPTYSDSDLIDVEKYQEKLSWLQNSIEPWHMVEKYWNDTSIIRLEPIKLGIGETTVEEYFKLYPALQQPQGYTLLLQDFGSLYGDKNDGLYSTIILVREKIIALAREKQTKIRDKDLNKTIKNYINLTNDCDIDTLTNIALILLPYVIGISQTRRRGKSLWKPSRSEIRDGFITQSASEAEVTSIIQTRREKLQTLGRTLQPFIIYVGESVAQVRTAYVIVNNICYNFDKLVTAVDAAFKIFQATGAYYPDESHDIWIVIQIGFYKIKTRFDRTNQSTTSLLNDLGLL